jgi:hypothetical protein
MLGRMAIIAGAVFLLLAWTMPFAIASQDIVLNDQYQMTGKNVIVHLIEINMSDSPMGNVYAPDYPNTKWIRLVYTFENFGDTTDKGFIQPTLIGSDNAQFQSSDYTGQNVLPRTTAGPFFIEIPVPKDTVLVKLICVEGFDQHEFNIPPPAAPPTPGPSATSTASASPASGGNNWGGCLPLIPFAMVGGIAGIGMVINRCGIRKR